MTGEIKTYETALGKYWLDGEILHFQAGNAPRTIPHVKENFGTIRRAMNNKKVCLLADLSDISPLEKDTRDYIVREVQQTYSAVAFVSDSHLGNVIAKMFLMLKEPGFPGRKFSDEKEAIAWLKQFRDPAFR
ncbi:MAG: STAS/SEC14 domain-containing protein [Bacteroidia bacterium]